MVVGVESDRRVNELKGAGRPINRLQKRVDNLIKTSLPDFIFPLPQKFGASADHELLISRLRPTILAVSSHTLHMDEKKAMVSRHGGELRVVLSHNPKISTSEIVKRGCST